MKGSLVRSEESHSRVRSFCESGGVPGIRPAVAGKTAEQRKCFDLAIWERKEKGK